jgi:hypothetical protein
MIKKKNENILACPPTKGDNVKRQLKLQIIANVTAIPKSKYEIFSDSSIKFIELNANPMK